MRWIFSRFVCTCQGVYRTVFHTITWLQLAGRIQMRELKGKKRKLNIFSVCYAKCKYDTHQTDEGKGAQREERLFLRQTSFPSSSVSTLFAPIVIKISYFKYARWTDGEGKRNAPSPLINCSPLRSHPTFALPSSCQLLVHTSKDNLRNSKQKNPNKTYR